MTFNFSRPRFKTGTQPVMTRDMLRASASLNFPSVAAAAAATLTIAVPGARVGDDADVYVDAPNAGLVYRAYVSASDVVTVRVINVTAGAVDAAAATHRVIVWKAA